MLNLIITPLDSPFALPLIQRFKEKGYAVHGFDALNEVNPKAIVYIFQEGPDAIEKLKAAVEELSSHGVSMPFFCVSYSLLSKDLIEEINLELKAYPDPVFYYAFPYVFGKGIPLTNNPTLAAFFLAASKEEKVGEDLPESFDFVLLSDAIDQVENGIISYLEYPKEDEDKPIGPEVYLTLSREELYSFVLAVKGSLGKNNRFLFTLSSPIKRVLFTYALPYFSALPLKEVTTEFGYIRELYKDPEIGQFTLFRFEKPCNLGWNRCTEGVERVALLKGVIGVKTVQDGKLKESVLSDPLKNVVEIAENEPRCIVAYERRSMMILFSAIYPLDEKRVEVDINAEYPSLLLSLEKNKAKENPYEELDKVKSAFKEADPWGKKRKRKKGEQ